MKATTRISALTIILYVALYSGASVAGVNGQLSFQVDLVLGSSQYEDEYFFGNVLSVVVDSKGRIYVADRSQPCVHKFTSDGEYLGQLGKSGGGPGDIMPIFVIAIDSSDKLYIAGQGGRVEVVDTDWNYVASFNRNNPASIARRLALFSDGRIAIAAPGRSTGTTVDLYTSDLTYDRSCSKSFSFDSGLPHYIEAPFVGGYIVVSGADRLYFAQMAPFLVRSFDGSGAVVDSTTAGGDEFVGYPLAPVIDGDSVTYLNSPRVTGIVSIGDGGILVSAGHFLSEDMWRTQFCAFDSELNLLGCLEEDGLSILVGGTGDGTVFIHSGGNDEKLVTRAKVMYVNP